MRINAGEGLRLGMGNWMTGTQAKAHRKITLSS
jgi:hypothetical protein